MRVNHKREFIFYGVYLTVFTICAIAPYDRAVWWAENTPIMLLVAGIAWVQTVHRFSPLAYFFMAFLVLMHTIGGHYTFARVPFGFLTDLFGFERNHYDRIAHFTVGFYAFAIAELLMRKRLVTSVVVLGLFPVFAIFTVAAVYEVFEWAYAVAADPNAGIAVLGSQGDVWDAQKDILADGLGALFAIALFFAIYRGEVSSVRLARNGA